jgi:hypothetical protein
MASSFFNLCGWLWAIKWLMPKAVPNQVVIIIK